MNLLKNKGFISKLLKSKTLLFSLYYILIIYLLINTGIISDDFDAMAMLRKNSDYKNIFYFIETPVQYFTHYIWYFIFSIKNQFTVNLVKIIYILLSFYLISKFFSIYLNKENALWAAFLFIFFPSHESTVYFFMLQYLTLSFAFYLYAFYLAYREKLTLAFIFGLLGSFISYGSTPLAITLAFLFALNRNFKKSAIMIIPNIIYSIYFIQLNIFMRIGSPRIIENLTPFALVKQFMLQILTSIDSLLGPILWIKIFYSFTQLTLLSFIIGVIFTVVFYKININDNGKKYNFKVILSLMVLLLLSFLMFAFTGRYPQIVFNLGNRTSIFGALLMTYLVILLPASRRIRTLVFAVMIFSILGISDHWKKWNTQQINIINNIKENYSLNHYNNDEIIYVSGNQYSKYGPISHIEFFSEDWVPKAVLTLALDKNISARCLNRRHIYRNGYIIDTKYDSKIKINDYINVYDSEKNILFRLSREDINSYIASLPLEKRHWIQILDNKIFENIVTKLMPRLKYIFENVS